MWVKVTWNNDYPVFFSKRLWFEIYKFGNFVLETFQGRSLLKWSWNFITFNLIYISFLFAFLSSLCFNISSHDCFSLTLEGITHKISKLQSVPNIWCWDWSLLLEINIANFQTFGSLYLSRSGRVLSHRIIPWLLMKRLVSQEENNRY